MNKKLIEIEALPTGICLWPDERSDKPRGLTTDDLRQLAREYRALMAVLEAAESRESQGWLMGNLPPVIAEARRVIGGSDDLGTGSASVKKGRG